MLLEHRTDTILGSSSRGSIAAGEGFYGFENSRGFIPGFELIPFSGIHSQGERRLNHSRSVFLGGKPIWSYRSNLVRMPYSWVLGSKQISSRAVSMSIIEPFAGCSGSDEVQYGGRTTPAEDEIRGTWVFRS